ncbi:MAG: Replication factor C small subunit, partial [Nanoarchaeota archaeon]
QHSLRRMMETYSNTSRFILSCNYSSKIIDPIQSRCSVFRFRPLEKDNIKEIIKNIAKHEKIKVDDDAVDAIYELSEGDARKAENILQSCSSVSENITKKIIFSTVSAAEPKEVIEILELALKKEFLKAREKLSDVMIKHGLSGLDIIKQIQKEVWKLNIKNENKVRLIEKCGETEFRMVEGSDEFLQLEALLAAFTVAER